jgi:hypothetical protein
MRNGKRKSDIERSANPRGAKVLGVMGTGSPRVGRHGGLSGLSRAHDLDGVPGLLVGRSLPQLVRLPKASTSRSRPEVPLAQPTLHRETTPSVQHNRKSMGFMAAPCTMDSLVREDKVGASSHMQAEQAIAVMPWYLTGWQVEHWLTGSLARGAPLI